MSSKRVLYFLLVLLIGSMVVLTGCPNPTGDDGDDSTTEIDESAGEVGYYGVVVTSAVEDSPEVDWEDAVNGNALITETQANMPSGAVASVSGGTYTFNVVATADPADGTAQTVPATDPAGNSLDDTDFIGAVDPNGTDWTSDWVFTPEKTPTGWQGDLTTDDGLTPTAVDYTDPAAGATGTINDNSGDTIDGRPVYDVAGIFKSDITWTEDAVYRLNGAVFIGDDSYDSDGDGVLDAGATPPTLTIGEGTKIVGVKSSSDPGALIISRGAKINAQGTADEPIIMTSDQASNAAAGDWGGIIINGFAPIQESSGLAEGEGSTGTYGGADATDDSGTLNYVVVQYAGTLFSPENELNGIAFQGVGSGTTVDYIQVHQNADDGVEFFGGSVAVKHVVLTGNQDDSLDHDDGWNGSAQYVVIQQYPGGDHGIEGDGDPAKTNSLTGTVIDPVSAVLANFTYIGNTDTDDGFRFRRDASPSVYNTLITNVADGENSIDEKTTSD